jgi:tetratricopeptide (TPR) repeat protein
MKSSIRHIWLTIFLILVLSGNTFSQLSNVDKLRLQISKEKNDTTKANLLIKLGLKDSIGYSERINCFRRAYSLSKKENYRYGLVFGKYYEVLELSKPGSYLAAIEKSKRVIEGLDSLHVIQFLYLYPLAEIRGLFNSAGKQEEKFRYYQEKLAFYKKYGPVENTADCYHGIAGYYWYLSDFDKAIEYYMRARDVYRSFDPLGYASETQVIGSEYLAWGNLDKAEEYLKAALADLVRLNEAFYCYHQLGDLYFIRQDYAKALQYYFLGKQYCIYTELKAINLVNCAMVYIQFEKMDSARFYLDSAERIRQKENLGLVFPNGNAEIDYTYYKFFLARHNEKRALHHLESAMQVAQSENYLPLILKYAKELHSFLLKQGDSLRALRYLVQYHTIQDSLNKMNTQARIASFEIEQQQQQKEDEIENLKVQKSSQRNYYLLAGALLLLIVIGVISRIFYKRKRDKEQLTTDFKKQLAQAETKALRAQMNPHFIFNSLNSINSFVMDQKHEIASDYLIKFSKLIRLILDNSRSETISIEKELETLKLYVVLEAARFENKFKCVYHVAEDVDTNSIKIPPMLLQPFVENAIWHGLMQKEGEGTITIDISMSNEQITDNSEQLLRITITDDGIGREKAAKLKSKSATHKSHGLKVTSQRIEMMNKLNSSGAQVNIVDLKDEEGKATGTRVELIIPF